MPQHYGTMGLVETHSAGIGAPSWWWCTKRLTWQPWTSSTVIPTALCAACRALAHRVGGCAGYRAYRVGSGGEVNKGWGLWIFWIYLDMFTEFRCLVALKEEWHGMSIGCIPQIFLQDKFFAFALYSLAHTYVTCNYILCVQIFTIFYNVTYRMYMPIIHYIRYNNDCTYFHIFPHFTMNHTTMVLPEGHQPAKVHAQTLEGRWSKCHHQADSPPKVGRGPRGFSQ